jgi:hypothetical protein
MAIDIAQFQRAHQAFNNLLVEETGEPFNGFDNEYLFRQEIHYKNDVHINGTDAIGIDNWNSWSTGEGKILKAVRKACLPAISHNLLEHRYGGPLDRVKTDDEIHGLESALVAFLKPPPGSPGLGDRFDIFADYLRSHKLGCQWPFVCYLLFLYDSRHFFPIRPTRFEALLRFYRIDAKIAGYVEWSRYTTLLDLADELKDRLAHHGTPNMIEIQSYMWMVSSLIDGIDMHAPVETKPDFAEEATRRIRTAERREQIGILGEKYVYDQEYSHLQDSGCQHLAARVRMISIEGDDTGYDILSFGDNGDERHIEVKTTTYSRDVDNGFWLTQNEQSRARDDKQWRIYRVWNIDSIPELEDLGNIIREPSKNWMSTASSFYFQKI